ncbi:DUF3084 domain-containing protein [Halanaerocella petrolearia]
MYGIQLVLILIVAGGLIAYVGDKIGMKVGRKRLSLCGLRPKYTSIIITIITGVLIALSSLGLLLLSSQNVRQALFDMQALLERLNNLNQTVQAKNNRLTTLQDEIEDKSLELTTIQQDKKKLNNRLGDLKEEYEEVKEHKLKLESRVEELSLQQEALNQQVNNLAHNLGLFGKRYFSSLTGDIIYPKGEVITSGTVRQVNSISSLENKLQQLIEDARKVAEEKGLGRGKVTYNQQEFEKVIDILANRDEQMIIRLLVAKNTFQNEDLKLKFDLYRDYRVYNLGTTILEQKISFSNLSDLEVELDRLVDKLNKQVIRDGMLPDTKGQVVDFKLAQLYPLVDKMLSAKNSRTIKIVAQDDIWRNDDLVNNIRLQVKK